MDLDAYVAEHAAEWRRLDQLSRRRRVTAAEADELVALYQRAATHLSVVRSRSPDPALVARLSRLVLAARNAITGAPAFSWSRVGHFFTAGFPLAVYRAWPWWSGVATSFSLIAFGIMGYVVANPEVADQFMDDATITRMIQSDFVGYYSQFASQNQTLRVWTNNAVLTAECLAGGVLILPVVIVLFYNAFNIGLTGGVMIAYGRGDVFFGMIMPHGLLAIRMSQARPGRLRAQRAQAHAGRDGRRRAAAGAARRAFRSRDSRHRRIEAGVLRRHRLAEKDRPGCLAATPRRRILPGDSCWPRASTRRGRPIEDIEDVLDADGDAMQRAAILSVCSLIRQPLGLGPGVLAIDEHPGMHMRLPAVDGLQALLDQIDGVTRRAPDGVGGFVNGVDMSLCRLFSGRWIVGQCTVNMYRY